MNKNLRTALRFAAYIRAMGGDPIPFRHGSHREWALNLQRQHERLRQGVAPEYFKAAKASARALIRQKGYRRAAEEVAPVHMTAVFLEPACGNNVGTGAESSAQTNPAALSGKDRRALKRDKYLCRRKLRHIDYWSAVRHALRLGGEVQVFECAQCGGLHVGHDPEDPGTKQYKHAQKRLRLIQSRLAALEEEQKALIRERSQLLSQLRKLDDLALIHSGFLLGALRLFRIVSLRTEHNDL